MDGLRAKLNDLGGDLLKDLRDRRLLPLVVLLLVAIVAVPLLLGGGGGEEAPAPAPLAEVPEGGEELEAVVTAGGAGLRDFHHRLDGRPRNPFKQQYPGASRGQGDGSGSQPESSAEGAGTPTGSSAVPGPSGVTDPPEAGPETPTPEPPENETQPPRRITRLIKMTIDVRLFHAGESRDIEGVEALSPVPGAKTPLTRFIGATRDAKRASFVVSPAVVSTEGDGNCDPGRNDCQFLILEPGESQYFRYGEKQKRYRLKLLAIHRELVAEQGAKGGEGEDGPVAAEVG